MSDYVGERWTITGVKVIKKLVVQIIRTYNNITHFN